MRNPQSPVPGKALGIENIASSPESPSACTLWAGGTPWGNRHPSLLFPVNQNNPPGKDTTNTPWRGGSVSVQGGTLGYPRTPKLSAEPSLMGAKTPLINNAKLGERVLSKTNPPTPHGGIRHGGGTEHLNSIIVETLTRNMQTMDDDAFDSLPYS